MLWCLFCNSLYTKMLSLALQLAMLLVYTTDISAGSDVSNGECSLKNITPFHFSPKKLFSGRWNFVKCLPSSFCTNLLCFVNDFDHEDLFDFSVETSAFNTSNGKVRHLNAIITYLGEGRFKMNSADEMVNNIYVMLGTDYENYWVSYSCMENASGHKEPAAWIGSRREKLDKSVTPPVMETLQKNGLDMNKFISTYDDLCEDVEDDFD